MGGVVVDKYYQNGKYTGYTSFAVHSWFSWTEPATMKERFSKLIANVPEARIGQATEVFGSGVYGIFIKHNGCVYLTFYTRSKGEGIADNDDGNGDTIGKFKTCEGFMVPVEKFIRLIDEASEEDATGLQAAKRKRTSSVPEEKTNTQSKMTNSTKKVDSSGLIERLRRVKSLYDSKLVTEEEYKAKKKEILAAM